MKAYIVISANTTKGSDEEIVIPVTTDLLFAERMASGFTAATGQAYGIYTIYTDSLNDVAAVNYAIDGLHISGYTAGRYYAIPIGIYADSLCPETITCCTLHGLIYSIPELYNFRNTTAIPTTHLNAGESFTVDLLDGRIATICRGMNGYHHCEIAASYWPEGYKPLSQ